MRLSRRGMAGWAAGGIALAGTATLGVRRFLGPRYAPSPYDDLFARLVDRAEAARLGTAALATMPNFNANAVAARLRRRLDGKSLAAVAGAEAIQGHLRDVGGWLVPDSVAELSALAAKA